jgi:arylsulfatase A-like enzyme
MKTPFLDAFARESVVFDGAYAGSFPTVPNRHDVFTGRSTYTHFDWGPLPNDSVVISEVLGKAGLKTMMIIDTPHLLQDGYNFSRGFDGFIWVRGQENDHYRTYPREVRFPCDPSKLRVPELSVSHYLRNVYPREDEKDYFVCQTMQTAMDWLDENHNDGDFFLYVDTFDPHEPWDPPREYVDLYDPGYGGEEVIYPRYDYTDFLTDEELRHAHALYCGEATLVDKWVGKLIRKIGDLGLDKNTMVIFTTDHGFLHGEHGIIGKLLIIDTRASFIPLYEEIARIPLMVRMPEGPSGSRTDALVQPADLMPTILDWLGIEIPKTVNGRSFLPVLQGKTKKHRELTVSTPSLITTKGSPRWSTIADGEWTLFFAPAPEGPDESPTYVVDSREKSESSIFTGAEFIELYHLPTDPNQENNVLSGNIDVAKSLHKKYIDHLRQLGTEDSIVEFRSRFGIGC